MAFENKVRKRTADLKRINPSNSLYVGTSGWTYADWRGRFYPKDIPRKEWLHWYATQFLATEINGSFYRTPSIEAVRAWHDATPANFRFAWKASKFITHWKRLSPKSENSIELMLSRLKERDDLLRGRVISANATPQAQVDQAAHVNHGSLSVLPAATS